jgi:hypothetical protein
VLKGLVTRRKTESNLYYEKNWNCKGL